MRSPETNFWRLSTAQARCLLWGGLVPLHLLLLGWIACRYSPTSDEIAHMAAGVRIWTTGQFDVYPVNPPLVKCVATLPVVLDPPQTDWSQLQDSPGARPEWILGQDFLRANASRFRWDFVLARWACLPFSVLGLVYCFRWGTALFGPASGLMAATLWCFSPNILGNGALITPDVAATSLGVATLFHFREWLRSSSWRAVLVTGLLLGLTELAKMTWLILYGLLPLFWLISEFLRTRFREDSSASRNFQSLELDTPQTPRSTVFTRGLQLALILFISLETLNTGYLFEGTLQPLGRFQFVSESLTGKASGIVGNRFASTWLGTFPVPLPRSYVLGIDLQRRDLENHHSPLVSYLRGELRNRGWWYYYLYGLMVKVPLGVWLIAVSSVMATVFCHSAMRSISWLDRVLLLGTPLVLFVFVSSQTGFSRYFRYVLPCFPFLWIAMSSVWSKAAVLRSKCLSAVAGVGLLWAIGASLVVYPNSLAFFHLAAGGPEQGHWHLLDSNIDWGQDLYALQDWQEQHPEAAPLYLAYSGVADPRLFEIDTQPLPEDNISSAAAPAPGWYAVSVNHLHGYDDPACRWCSFLERTSVDRAGGSILIYHIIAERD